MIPGAILDHGLAIDVLPSQLPAGPGSNTGLAASLIQGPCGPARTAPPATSRTPARTSARLSTLLIGSDPLRPEQGTTRGTAGQTPVVGDPWGAAQECPSGTLRCRSGIGPGVPPREGCPWANHHHHRKEPVQGIPATGVSPVPGSSETVPRRPAIPGADGLGPWPGRGPSRARRQQEPWIGP